MVSQNSVLYMDYGTYHATDTSTSMYSLLIFTLGKTQQTASSIYRVPKCDISEHSIFSTRTTSVADLKGVLPVCPKKRIRIIAMSRWQGKHS